MPRTLALVFSLLVLLVAATVSVSLRAQTGLGVISFDEIPEDSELVAGSQPIQLRGETQVTGNLGASGEISPGAGIRYPDGSLQLSALGAAAAPSGHYVNRIADVTLANDFTEICIKPGGPLFDIHVGGDSTAGGDCLPGDVGWIIERFERDGGTATTWAQARLTCLEDGMRLPEPFEFEVTCDDANQFAVSDMTDAFEWSSNSTFPMRGGTGGGWGVQVTGNGGCRHSTWSWTGNSVGSGATWSFRCVL